MGDPGALDALSLEAGASNTLSQDLTLNSEESLILDFLRNNPSQRADIRKYIGVTKNKISNKKNMPITNSASVSATNPGFFIITAPTSISNTIADPKTTATNPIISVANPTNSAQFAPISASSALKRQRSPGTPETAIVPQQVRTTQERQASSSGPAEPGNRRLTVILGTSLPAALKKDRRELINAVKFAAPAGVKLGEIRLTKNEDVLISCLTPHDHNTCLRTDKWTQAPHTFIPRFNLSASNGDIVYIKSVPTEMDLLNFDELLKSKKINFSNLERIKTGKDRSDSLTLRLLVHDKQQKEKLIKEGLLLDHKKFNLEPHVKTSVKQCFRCLEYGHLIADCTSSQCCTRCGGDHPHKDCPTDRNSPTCANCMKDEKISPERRNHAASDRSCPTRIRLLREARRLDLKNKKTIQIPLSGSNGPAPFPASRSEFPDLKSTSNFGFASSSGPTASLRPTAAVSSVPKIPTFGQVAGINHIFGEDIIDPVLLDKAHQDKNTDTLSTVLTVVADALGEILQGLPGVNQKKISDSLLRSVGRLNDKSIDLASVARKLMRTNDGSGSVPSWNQEDPSASLHPPFPKPGWSSAMSNQVIDDSFKKPYAPPSKQQQQQLLQQHQQQKQQQQQQQEVEPPKPKRRYNKKKPPQATLARQRTMSETGSDCSQISISSASCLGIHSTPTGHRLAAAYGSSPLLGRQSAPLSPTSSLLMSPGGSNYHSPISVDISQTGDDTETSVNDSEMETSLLGILRASNPLPTPSTESMVKTTVQTEQAGAEMNPAETQTPATQAVATDPATPNQNTSLNRRNRKPKNQTSDSKPDG